MFSVVTIHVLYVTVKEEVLAYMYLLSSSSDILFCLPFPLEALSFFGEGSGKLCSVNCLGGRVFVFLMGGREGGSCCVVSVRVESIGCLVVDFVAVQQCFGFSAEHLHSHAHVCTCNSILA